MHPLACLSPVASCVFLRRGQLRHHSRLTLRDEKRVIAKSLRSSLLVRDAPLADSWDQVYAVAHRAIVIHQGKYAAKPRGALFVRDALQCA